MYLIGATVCTPTKLIVSRGNFPRINSNTGIKNPTSNTFYAYQYGVIPKERHADPTPPNSIPPKLPIYLFGLKRCAMFSNVYKNNFPIFLHFLV